MDDQGGDDKILRGSLGKPGVSRFFDEDLHRSVVAGVGIVSGFFGTRLAMSRKTFIPSRHDYEAELPVSPDAKKYYYLGVFIRGTPQTSHPEFVETSVIPWRVEPVGMRSGGFLKCVSRSSPDNGFLIL